MYIAVYIDAFDGGFLSALAARDHYSVAVGCLWGCSRAENRANETGRGEAVAIDLPEGSIVDRKSRQFKRTPGASFSARHAKEQKRRRVRERGNRCTLDFEQAIMLLRNVYNEIIVSGILRPGCLESFLYHQFYSTKGPVDCRRRVFCGRK